MYVAQPVKGIVNRLLGAMEVYSIWVRLELAAIGKLMPRSYFI